MVAATRQRQQPVTRADSSAAEKLPKLDAWRSVDGRSATAASLACSHTISKRGDSASISVNCSNGAASAMQLGVILNLFVCQAQ